MTKLISKIQYKTFETGEFVEEKERTYEAVIELAEQFPWNAEREHLVVNLTNPSITIQKENNDFLKLALFFNGKYVLHYFNREQILFTKSFNRLQDTYTFINSYFHSTDFDTSNFKKENTWLQHNLQHFVSQNFHYEVTPKSARHFLWTSSGLNLSIGLFFIVLFIISSLKHIALIALLFIFLYVFLAGGGINLILFFNYYHYAKGKILIMSKGNDIFYYGNKEVPEKYDKKEIMQFTTIRVHNYRSPISEFAIIKIEFKDASEIKIPDIFVSYSAIESKLLGCLHIDKKRFPFIKA